MPLIIPANTISGGYEVANSLRFDDGSDDNLTRTPSSSSNQRTFTFSFWIKQAKIQRQFITAQLLDTSNFFGS